MAISILRII